MLFDELPVHTMSLYIRVPMVTDSPNTYSFHLHSIAMDTTAAALASRMAAQASTFRRPAYGPRLLSPVLWFNSPAGLF